MKVNLWFVKSVAPPLEFFAFSDYYLLFLIIICFFLIIIMHIGTFITHLSFIEFWSCWLVRVLVVENPIHIVIGLPSEWPDWELDYYYYVEDFGFETEKSCNAADLASLQPESDWKKRVWSYTCHQLSRKCERWYMCCIFTFLLVVNHISLF